MRQDETEARHRIESEAELDALYGAPVSTSLLKELDHLSPEYRAFIEASPFLVIATAGPEGLDCSPRGDPAGFCRVPDERTVLIPDRRGNNRIDSLRNIVRDDRVALIFLVPGVGETMRVNGRAAISTDPDLLAAFAIEGKPPRSVIAVTVERAYPQCPKALVRSRLWTDADHAPVPTMGEMMAGAARTKAAEPVDARAYDAAYPKRLAETIY